MTDIAGAVLMGFEYMERMDQIVGVIYVSPSTAKKIVIAMPDEVHFDYIPEGIGMVRTAYLKFKPTVRGDELRFLNQDETVEVRVILV
jgi:hypothetical protein